jgi:ABC-2 type transport system ATP-binding protein
MAREKVVVVTVDNPVAECPVHPAFVKCEKVGEQVLEVTYNKDKTNAGEVLSLIQGQGMNIVDVTTREADLEDVFVHLTSAAAA